MQRLPLLIGQYDSPFVRRVAIAMLHYGIDFEHRPLSVFRDAEAIAPYNPLRRVPTLVLPTGEVLVESFAILDFLDEGAPPERLLLPRSGDARRMGLGIAALACSLADKGVALVYETVARESGNQSPRWSDRCKLQVSDTLGVLEDKRRQIRTRFWLGDQLSHADIAVAVVIHFLRQGVPHLVDSKRLPALILHEQTCHELSIVAQVNQPLHFPR